MLHMHIYLQSMLIYKNIPYIYQLITKLLNKKYFSQIFEIGSGERLADCHYCVPLNKFGPTTEVTFQTIILPYLHHSLSQFALNI